MAKLNQDIENRKSQQDEDEATTNKELDQKIVTLQPQKDKDEAINNTKNDPLKKPYEFFYSLAKKALEGEGSLHFH